MDPPPTAERRAGNRPRKDGRMDRETREKAGRRLSRIEGQVRGLRRMVEEDRYCIDVLHQLSSVQQALNGVARVVTESHLRHCTMAAMQSGDPEQQERVIEELLETAFSVRKR